MALDSAQRALVNSLMEKPQTTKQLMLSTGLSDTTVRQNLKILLHDRELEIDKERQPYMYSVAESSTEYRTRQAVDKAKDIIRGVTETQNAVMKAVKAFPKETLPDLAVTLRSIAEAIDEMAADGELIDTLEVR